MPNSDPLSRSRLLVRGDRTAVRLGQLLLGGKKRTPTHGPAPELKEGAPLKAGRLYPDHSAADGQTWVERWEFGSGEKLQLSFEYWGAGEPPAGVNGPLGNVGRITGSLVAPAPPATTGSAAPVVLDPTNVQAVLRYTVELEGSEIITRRELVLDRLATPIGEDNPAAARIGLPIRSQQDAETIYSALQHPDTVLVLRAEVTTWQRSWNQTLVGDHAATGSVATVLPTGKFKTLKINTEILAAAELHHATVRPVVTQPILTQPADVRPRPRPPIALRPLTATPVLLHTSASTRPPPSAIVRPVVAEPPVVGAPAPTFPPRPIASTQLLRPQTLKVFATSKMTMLDAKAVSEIAQLKLGGRNVAPSRALVAPSGEPAWVSVQTPVEWELPFYFPIGGDNTNIYKTGTLGLNGLPTILKAISDVTDESGQPILGLYREVVIPSRIHFVPQVFRLARAPTSPYLPALRMVASEFIAGDEEGEEPEYRVSVAYALEPWLPPGIRQAVANAMEIAPHELQFSVTQPLEMSLKLTLPSRSGPSERAEATMDANGRISDVLDLSPEEFAWFVATLRDEPAGILGTVQVTLLDGQQTAESQVQLGLGFESEFLLDTVVIGRAADSNRWSVRLRNRIESKLRIEECRALALAEGVVAAPLADSVPIDAELRPGEWRDVVYQVSPIDAPFVVETLPVRATPLPDVESLLRMLVVPTQVSAGSVSVEVTGIFPTSTPDGDEPIIALRVEFDDESVVEVTPTAPTAQVQLAGRLLDVALGRQIHRYFYRVQNVTSAGQGAATGWRPANVGPSLTVPWVVASLATSEEI